MAFHHISVLLDECIRELKIKPEGTYVDGTLGGAGHGSEVCARLSEQGTFIGIDQDEQAIAHSTQRLKDGNYPCKIEVVHSNYSNFTNIMQDLEITGVDGILLDLGVSSVQLDTAERGFSYMQDAPLDMRMDLRQTKTAASIVNEYSYDALTKIFRIYGEEQFANNIAKNIVAKRENKRIETTFELVEIIQMSIPMKVQKKLGHPGKRVFQAIRIELNQELTVLTDTLEAMIEALNPGGRLCVITFHSLEDRIVKRIFKEQQDPCTCPPNFPVCVCGQVSKGKVITRKPILPTEEELAVNSRSKSAKLRVFEKVTGDDRGEKSR